MKPVAKEQWATIALIPLLSSLVSASVMPVYAQSSTLEEVVVVARKREESLQDTPVAVSAFDTVQLREAQITNVADLARIVPGLSNKDGDRVSGLAIRGVGSRAVGSATDPGVGVYVDGLFMPRSDTQLVDVVDMASIQVLRGPQGTLFGKNTAGGALLLETRKPTDVFEAQVEVGTGNYDRQNLSLRVDGPLFEDKLFAALTYDRRKEEGYMDDYFTGRDYGDTDRKAVVGQLRWLAASDLTVDLLTLWGERREHAAPNSCISLNPDAALQIFASTTPGVFGDFCALSEALIDDEKVIMDPRGMDYDVTNNLAGLTVLWDVGDVRIKSVTGYLYQDDLKRDHDIDATSFWSLSNFQETVRNLRGSGFNAGKEERTFVSQEFNVFGSLFDGDMDYTLGLYASNEDIEDQVDGQTLSLGGWVGQTISADGAVLLFNPAAIGSNNIRLVDYTSTSSAGFGQFIYNFNEIWQFTVGGRLTWEEKKINQRNYTTNAVAPTNPVSRAAMNALQDFQQPMTLLSSAPRFNADDDWVEFTPMVTATLFAPDSWTDGFLDSGMFYLSYSEGFKAGGFTSFGPDQALPFDPETVKSTEFGFKLEALSQRLRVNGAIYFMDYEDMQLGVTRQFGELQTIFGITNAGDAEVYGVELEVVAMPLPGLLINFTGSNLRAEYKTFVDEFVDNEGLLQITDRSEEPFSYIPDQTYSLAVQYDWQVEDVLVRPRVSGFYKDKVYTGLDPAAFLFEDQATLDAYAIWNARLAFVPSALESLEIAIFAQNLTDKKYFGTGTVEAARLGTTSVIRGKPRSYGIDVFYYW
ncbi:MAG: TonB-dependent receptor [Halioglobus sp.]|nr:TonB-dependent receptor [Halioglobus sp.]